MVVDLMLVLLGVVVVICLAAARFWLAVSRRISSTLSSAPADKPALLGQSAAPTPAATDAFGYPVLTGLPETPISPSRLASPDDSAAVVADRVRALRTYTYWTPPSGGGLVASDSGDPTVRPTPGNYFLSYSAARRLDRSDSARLLDLVRCGQVLSEPARMRFRSTSEGSAQALLDLGRRAGPPRPEDGGPEFNTYRAMQQHSASAGPGNVFAAALRQYEFDSVAAPRAARSAAPPPPAIQPPAPAVRRSGVRRSRTVMD